MIQLQTYTLKAMLKQTVERHRNRPALTMVDAEPITYQQLDGLIDDVIDLMRDHGIQKGDRVAILSQNMPNWGVAYLAITSMGAIVVPILVDFHLSEILQIIRHSGAKAIFVSALHYDKVAYSDLDPMPVMFNLESLETVDPNLPKDKITEFIQERSMAFKRLRNKAKEAVGLAGEPHEDDLAAIIYTSGTTGSSKGVMLTHRNLVRDAWLTLHIQEVNERDRLISVLPLSHTYECTIGFIIPMMTGACVYYLDKPPTARILIPAMQKVKPTMILTVPLIIE
ncbi:MAG TPA: AMP-binding protein, partial [Candidatus Cloacimonadota bacterium]|nr:AMP-binding protein [Candidatus Cloacimonadota bacterium]